MATGWYEKEYPGHPSLYFHGGPPFVMFETADWEREKKHEVEFIERLKAEAGDYFWIPCPNCGRMFGGHEKGGGTLGENAVSGWNILILNVKSKYELKTKITVCLSGERKNEPSGN